MSAVDARPGAVAGERYEQLRALAGRGGAAGADAAGVRVIQRRGVAAWMEADPGVEAAPGLGSASTRETGRPPIQVAADELARVLAAMLLGEAWP